MADLQSEIPEDDWFCQRCTTLKTSPSIEKKGIRCGLCTEFKGVLTNVSSGVFAFSWVHPICVIWNPYLSYKDFESK